MTNRTGHSGNAEKDELRRRAEQLARRSWRLTADDLLQDVDVKDLEKNFEGMARRADAPLRRYRLRSLNNAAIDHLRKKYPDPLPRPRDGESDFDFEAPRPRRLDALDRFQWTRDLLTDQDLKRAPKDLALLCRHGRILDFLGLLPRQAPKLINTLEIRAYVLARAASERRLSPRSTEIVREWSDGIVIKAAELQKWARRPDRSRPLKKLVKLADSLVNAVRAAGRATDLAKATGDLRRVAAVYSFSAFRLRFRRNRRTGKPT